MIVGVRTWALVVGVAMVLSAGLGAVIALWEPSPPPPPPRCYDYVGVYDASDTIATCPTDAELRTEILPDGKSVLVRCVCQRTPGGGT